MLPPLIYIEPRGGGKILRIRAPCGGSKPPPYSIITDISPNRGITPALPCKLYFVRVGAIHESPFVFPPLREGSISGGSKPPPYTNPVFRSFQKHPHKPQFVILSEAKDLQSHKINPSGTRFFAERLRMTIRRANTVRPYGWTDKPQFIPRKRPRHTLQVCRGFVFFCFTQRGRVSLPRGGQTVPAPQSQTKSPTARRRQCPTKSVCP